MSTTPAHTDPAIGQTEPKVTAATVGSAGTAFGVAVVTWLALRYLGLELTELQAMTVVTVAGGAGARFFGWLKKSWASRTSEAFEPNGIARPVTAEERRDSRPAVPDTPGSPPLLSDQIAAEDQPGTGRPPRPQSATPPRQRPGRPRGY